MVDNRITKTAKILVEHSARVKKNDLVQVSGSVETIPLMLEIQKLVLKKGGYPKLDLSVPGSAYNIFKYSSITQLKKKPVVAKYIAEKIDAHIGLGGSMNTKSLTNIDPKRMAMRRKVTREISEIYLKKKWVIFHYPTRALAQDAEMSLSEFEDFVYSAVIQDWKAEGKKQTSLKKILDKGKQVRIVGSDTDITFSIKGRKGIKSDGIHNMPSGEVFIGPVETSTEGYISYDYPAIYGGREVDGIKLWFKKGKVVKFKANKNEKLLAEMLKIDKGASYLGEFGIGTNFGIKKFVKQILFDEKIGGTIHLALGMAYKEGGGKNESALHWDMIKDLRKGGEIWIDNTCIQKNGKFKKGVYG